MRDEGKVTTVHSYDGMKVRVTIYYSDYRSNDHCTKYRDAIILLLSAALRYFRFGIRVVRVTEQSISELRKWSRRYRKYSRTFLSVNLITPRSLIAKRRSRSIARWKDIGEADSEKYDRTRISQWFLLERVESLFDYRVNSLSSSHVKSERRCFD